MSPGKKVLINPLVAVSVITQTDLIKKLLIEKGYQVEYKSCITVHDIKKEENYGFLWAKLATIPHLGDAVFPYLYCPKPKAVYVTIEGIPTKANLLCSNVNRMKFIANSGFTAESMKQVGLNVIDIVHHAIDYEKCQSLKDRSAKIRKKWNEEFEDRVIFLYVGRNDPRKGLDKLAKAVGRLNSKQAEDYVILLHIEGDPSELLGQQNVMKIGSVGGLDHESVLSLIGASDYLVFPSVCEGFGLPVLEANAMGIPAIHAWFPPLSEFSSQDFNFTFGYQIERMELQGKVQFWRFHEYRVELLEEMLSYAIKTKKDSPRTYEEYCQKARDHASKWDYRKMYPKLLAHLGIR